MKFLLGCLREERVNSKCLYSMIKLTIILGAGSLQMRVPLNLKLYCCLALLTSNKKSLSILWNESIVCISVQVMFLFSAKYFLKGCHQDSTSAISQLTLYHVQATSPLNILEGPTSAISSNSDTILSSLGRSSNSRGPVMT